jgi:hypothetical protein
VRRPGQQTGQLVGAATVQRGRVQLADLVQQALVEAAGPPGGPGVVSPLSHAITL